MPAEGKLLALLKDLKQHQVVGRDKKWPKVPVLGFLPGRGFHMNQGQEIMLKWNVEASQLTTRYDS